MKETIKQDILSVLEKSIDAIKKKDLVALRKQSNRTIHNSSIFQDKYSISTAVIIYSIYKILEKNKFKEITKWEFFEKFLSSELRKAIGCIEKDDSKGYMLSLKNVMKEMNKLDKNIGAFIDQVIHVTKVKKATKIVEHGISSSRVAELLGVPSWEVMSYLGNTKTFESPINISKSTKERLELAEKIFNLK